MKTAFLFGLITATFVFGSSLNCDTLSAVSKDSKTIIIVQKPTTPSILSFVGKVCAGFGQSLFFCSRPCLLSELRCHREPYPLWAKDPDTPWNMMEYCKQLLNFDF